MNRSLSQRTPHSLLDDPKAHQKLEVNYRKNKEQDHTPKIDDAVRRFDFDACKDAWWNPESFSLLHGTPLWDEASPTERLRLNQLYWVAYYSQIVSAEIATILLNQTCAAGMYSIEDFRVVCDGLDLESAQERAHINAFKTIGEKVEEKLFGERVFTYPMRSMYVETMIFQNSNKVKEFWRNIQLRAATMLTSGNAFLGCQYFAIRGLRTLNGKMIQQALAQPYLKAPDKAASPVPAQVSYFHFMDESFHFNTSRLLSHDVLGCLPQPGPFERFVANRAVDGCQKDHYHFSVAVKGIFWYDPALFHAVYRVLRSKVFGMDHAEAREMIRRCFTEESDGLHEAHRIHETAVQSYRVYAEPLGYLNAKNKSMSRMAESTIEGYLRDTRRAFARFEANA
ncbi:MAG: P-aminobenzoate N-oxygenase AurF [Elusimicrobia bacterium]|nr:P-aminobenzoate N-oxygenase AurF [Elusimicrobiota bacterium]